WRCLRKPVPESYAILTDPNPPVLTKLPSNVTKDEAIHNFRAALTNGQERFNEAEALAKAGKTAEAARLYERLCEECRTSWIERAARERLLALRAPAQSVPHSPPQGPGLAAKYPADRGIENDPAVLFHED